MPNTLMLDSDLAANLGECTLGEVKTLSVTGEVIKMKDGGYEFAVSDAQDEGGEEVAEEEEPVGGPGGGPPKAMGTMMEGAY